MMKEIKEIYGIKTKKKIGIVMMIMIRLCLYRIMRIIINENISMASSIDSTIHGSLSPRY